MKMKKILLTLAALLLVVAAGIGSSLAYFTTNVSARGIMTIKLGAQSSIEETFSDWIKHVTVKAADNSNPVYVRVKAFAGDGITLQYSGNNWSSREDGFWYYSDFLNAGEETPDELLISITGVPGTPEANESFNVAVVQEYTPVRYHEDGTPYADWNNTYASEGGN